MSLAGVAGLLLAASFEPLAVAWLMPFAVAGFAVAARGTTTRRGFLVGLCFGACFYFVHIWWMRAVGLPAWIALATLETLFYGLVGAFAALTARQRCWPVLFAAAWTAAEVLRSGWPLGGMPWGRLAFGVADTPAAPALAYVGAVGVSFAVALLAGLLAGSITGTITGSLAADGGSKAPRRSRKLSALGLIAVVAAFALPVIFPWKVVEDGQVRVAAVQGDVPGNGDDILYDHRQVTRNHVEATVDLARQVASGSEPAPDFVLWPENSTAVDPFRDAGTNEGIWRASSAIGVPILVGAIVDGAPGQALNQGIVWDPDTGAGERYTKWHPVPFGEYIPLRSIFMKYNFFDRLREVGRDMPSGTRREPLLIAGVKVADAICFDIAYDDGITAQLRNGARLLVVQSSQATFIHTAQTDQQFAITRLRAIETGRWVAVATTNGLSGLIAPDGEVLATADKRVRAVMAGDLGLSSQLTPAVRIGPWSGRLALLITAVALVIRLLPYRRRREHDAHAGGSESPQLQAVSPPSTSGGE